MAPERSKPLHNFSLPCLKWGNQKLLRCMKDTPNEEKISLFRSPASEFYPHDPINESDKKNRRSPNGGGDFRKPKTSADGIEQVREKLMIHLRTAADKMKLPVVQQEVEESAPPVVAPVARPWNLRTRRAACKAPNEGKISKVDEQRRQKSSSPQRNPSPKSLRLRGLAAGGIQFVEKEKEKDKVKVKVKERRKFSALLTRDEIEEDLFVMVGARPPRRPKKRPRLVQRQLDTLLPGLWLSEITPDTYKLPDEPETR